jgi:hypothetical protein
MQLINLIVIFLTLAYLLPRATMYFPAVIGNVHYYNLLAGLCVYIVQFLYNFYVQYTKQRTDLTLRTNVMESLIKGVIAVAAFYVYEEIHKYYNVHLPITHNEQKAVLVTLVFLALLLLKRLIRA